MWGSWKLGNAGQSSHKAVLKDTDHKIKNRQRWKSGGLVVALCLNHGGLKVLVARDLFRNFASLWFGLPTSAQENQTRG